ncbi:MAG: hypothetical protein JRI50_03550 [Deltaproteobacteria bacterium]|nr:hypothetical protein [Deltaproteobacteria bacterium]
MRTDPLFISEVIRQVLELIDYRDSKLDPFLREHLLARPLSQSKLSRSPNSYHVLWTANQYLSRDYPGFVGIDLGEPRVIGPRETARTILILAQGLNNVLPGCQCQQAFISFGTVSEFTHFSHCEFHFEFLLCFLKTIIAAMKGQSFKSVLIYKLNSFIRQRSWKVMYGAPQLH